MQKKIEPLRKHQPAEPRPPLRYVLARVADDSHCADDQQPPQISIAYLVTPTEAALLAVDQDQTGESDLVYAGIIDDRRRIPS